MKFARLAEPPKSAFGAAGLVLFGAFSIQWAAALAVPTFPAVGALAVSGWRFLTGAVILIALVRPKVRAWGTGEWRAAVLLGVSTAVMNLTFFQAIARIPLGTAVAIEFMGPFVVAALGHKSWRHLAFILLAAGGVVALCRPGGNLDLVGVLFILVTCRELHQELRRQPSRQPFIRQALIDGLRIVLVRRKSSRKAERRRSLINR